MKHLKIVIDMPVDEISGKINEHDALYAAREAYRAARQSLVNFIPYNLEDVTVKIEE